MTGSVLKKAAFVLVILWYITLVMVHYTNARPLWNDEACILLNIQRLFFPDIFTQPLINMQMFPRTYLWCIQRFSQLAGEHVLILRLMPLLMMLMAFSCWVYIIRRCWASDGQRLMAVSMWVASIPLIYYAAELKQYSADVLTASIMTIFLINQEQWFKSANRFSGFILVLLPLLGLFSYAVFLFYPIVGYNQIRLHQQNKVPVSFFEWVAAGLLVGVAISIFCFDMHSPNGATLRSVWSDYMISFTSPQEFFKTFGEGMNNLISRWFAEKPKWIRMAARPIVGLGLGYMLFSCWSVFKRQGYRCSSLVTISAALLAGHIVLGAWHVYPFVLPRTSLFFAPFLLALTVEALWAIYQKWPLCGRFVIAMVSIYLIFVSLGIGREVIIHGDLGAQTIIWQK